MKIIFLDIDGVVNVIPTEWDKYGSLFHEYFMDNLKKIIDKTGAKIVISSSWKGDGLETMQNMWRDRNYPGEVIDITPFEYDVVKAGYVKYYDEVIRGQEIDLWLKTHGDIESYVIIDDDSDMLPNQMDNFVYCVNEDHPDCIDLGYGLTAICAEKAIKILNWYTFVVM